MAAEDKRIDIFHRDVEFHRDKRPEPCCIQDAGHSHNTMAFETAHRPGYVRHDVERDLTPQ